MLAKRLHHETCAVEVKVLDDLRKASYDAELQASAFGVGLGDTEFFFF